MGAAAGYLVGVLVGKMVGVADGRRVGHKVEGRIGASAGNRVGPSVGNTVGAWVGKCVHECPGRQMCSSRRHGHAGLAKRSVQTFTSAVGMQRPGGVASVLHPDPPAEQSLNTRTLR